MSEMLGNQYFMARNYAEAERELEPVYSIDPSSKPVRRKLIICYTQNGNLEKALDVFHSLVKDDLQFIIDADPVQDDCPCEELISDINNSSRIENSFNFNLTHAIIWLYCDVKKSLEYLEKTVNQHPVNPKVDSARKIIKSYLKKQEVSTS